MTSRTVSRIYSPSGGNPYIHRHTRTHLQLFVFLKHQHSKAPILEGVGNSHKSSDDRGASGSKGALTFRIHNIGFASSPRSSGKARFPRWTSRLYSFPRELTGLICRVN